MKLVRAIRKGWLKTGKQRQKQEQPLYLLWGDDDQVRAAVLTVDDMMIAVVITKTSMLQRQSRLIIAEIAVQQQCVAVLSMVLLL